MADAEARSLVHFFTMQSISMLFDAGGITKLAPFGRVGQIA